MPLRFRYAILCISWSGGLIRVSSAAIRVNGATKSFGEGQDRIAVLGSVSFAVNQGSWISDIFTVSSDGDGCFNIATIDNTRS